MLIPIEGELKILDQFLTSLLFLGKEVPDSAKAKFFYYLIVAKKICAWAHE